MVFPLVASTSTTRRSAGGYCYGCGRGGTAFDFAAEWWDLSTRGADFLELRDRLAALFPGTSSAKRGATPILGTAQTGVGRPA